MEAIETKEYKGYTIEIVYDECGESPREAYDHLGTIYANSRNYNPDGELIDVFDKNGELDEEFLDKYYVWIPIYCYIHGGIALSTGRGGCFSDHWDSGLFGIIAVSKEDVLKEYGGKIVSKKKRERAEEVLRAEVKELHKFCNGEVYGFRVLDKNGNCEDSCYGYYVDDFDELYSEAESIVELLIK